MSLGLILALAFSSVAWPQAGVLAPVVSKAVSRTIDLPGEFLPYLSVSLYARVPGYVDRVLVDRGSAVQQGDLVAELSAPEMQSQIAEAQAKAQSADASRLEAEAQLASDESVYERMKKAAETPGAIAGNELAVAEKQVDAARALVGAREQAVRAAQNAAQALADLRSYLKVTAPFEGVVTERLAHPGALAGPSGPALVVIQQVSRLRLVVAVPEEDVGGIANGASAPFHVPAYPEKTYSGTVARLAHALDPKTRTMAVEMDVMNRDGSLAPGMYPTVTWPVKPSQPALYVPKTAVVTTTERTFVIRDRGGRAEWVDVKKGAANGDLMEVAGKLRPGDMVVRRGTDELRDGAAIPAGSK
ncbi:MAG: efflux RND transporter periplasmic adaptor subunit [Bryobacteraceae bacterium]